VIILRGVVLGEVTIRKCMIPSLAFGEVTILGGVVLGEATIPGSRNWPTCTGCCRHIGPRRNCLVETLEDEWFLKGRGV